MDAHQSHPPPILWATAVALRLSRLDRIPSSRARARARARAQKPDRAASLRCDGQGGVGVVSRGPPPPSLPHTRPPTVLPLTPSCPTRQDMTQVVERLLWDNANFVCSIPPALLVTLPLPSSRLLTCVVAAADHLQRTFHALIALPPQTLGLPATPAAPAADATGAADAAAPRRLRLMYLSGARFSRAGDPGEPGAGGGAERFVLGRAVREWARAVMEAHDRAVVEVICVDASVRPARPAPRPHTARSPARSPTLPHALPAPKLAISHPRCAPAPLPLAPPAPAPASRAEEYALRARARAGRRGCRSMCGRRGRRGRRRRGAMCCTKPRSWTCTTPRAASRRCRRT